MASQIGRCFDTRGCGHQREQHQVAVAGGQRVEKPARVAAVVGLLALRAKRKHKDQGGGEKGDGRDSDKNASSEGEKGSNCRLVVAEFHPAKFANSAARPAVGYSGHPPEGLFLTGNSCAVRSIRQGVGAQDECQLVCLLSQWHVVRGSTRNRSVDHRTN